MPDVRIWTLQQTPTARTEWKTRTRLNMEPGQEPGFHQRKHQHKLTTHHPEKREEPQLRHQDPAQGGPTRKGIHTPGRGRRNMFTTAKSSNGSSKSADTSTTPTTQGVPRGLSDRQDPDINTGKAHHSDKPREWRNSNAVYTRRRQSPRVLH